MFHKFAIYFLCLIFIFSVPASAWAQNCDVNYEAIVNMASPRIGSYNVWDATFGDETTEEGFKSGILTDDVFYLVAGERAAYSGGPITVLVKKLKRRGQSIWEKELQIEDLEVVESIVPHKDGFMVLGNKKTNISRRHKAIWIGFFSPEGELTKEAEIMDRNFSLELNHIMFRPASGDYFIAAAAAPNAGGAEHGRLMNMDSTGKVLVKRSFSPGLENGIHHITKVGERAYLATGYIRINDGRQVGWVIGLDHELNIRWEREFPRGRAASLDTAAKFIRNFVVVGGKSIPYGKNEKSAWIMVLEQDSGEIGWQRYYSGEMHYETTSLMVSRDGLISAMLSAQKPSGAKDDATDDVKDDFARLLTINPRGVLFISDNYFNSKGVQANEMFLGPNNERILVGRSLVAYVKESEDKENPDIEKSYDSWILAGAPVESYKDPCKLPQTLFP